MTYIIAGFVQNVVICLVIGILLTLGTLLVLKRVGRKVLRSCRTTGIINISTEMCLNVTGRKETYRNYEIRLSGRRFRPVRAVFAREAADRGKKVLVIDKRPNVAGNIYTETVEGIHVHKYGAHIFHTNDTKVWKYITQFAEFNRFTNSPVANYRGELYSLPFNMYFLIKCGAW